MDVKQVRVDVLCPDCSWIGRRPPANARLACPNCGGMSCDLPGRAVASRVAGKVLGIHSLEPIDATRDLHQISVQAIERALSNAFEVGRAYAAQRRVGQ
ncbi:MAG: hypothetical protein E7K72_19345 [Roseomonas mucosa]|nr:hypothetical protein [Roseomonas mucosa]